MLGSVPRTQSRDGVSAEGVAIHGVWGNLFRNSCYGCYGCYELQKAIEFIGFRCCYTLVVVHFRCVLQM